jgi:hypothetical protein
LTPGSTSLLASTVSPSVELPPQYRAGGVTC